MDESLTTEINDKMKLWCDGYNKALKDAAKLCLDFGRDSPVSETMEKVVSLLKYQEEDINEDNWRIIKG